MRNIDALLALATEQNQRDLAQMQDPEFEIREFERQTMETWW